LRHKDDHPWLAPPEPAPEVVADFKKERKKTEEDILKGPIGVAIGLTVFFFPPILLILIPIYMFTSKEDKEPGGEDLDANSDRDEDVVGENSDESQLPWWVIEEEAQG